MADPVREPMATGAPVCAARVEHGLAHAEPGQHVKGMPKSRRAVPPEPTPAPAGLASLLPTIRPQLASVRAAPPVGDRWLHEIKFDGYRTMAYVEQGDVRLITRNGLDWTRHYGHLASAF